MRTRLRRELTAAALVAAALVLLPSTSVGAEADEDTGAAGWQGLLGSRPVPELGGRWIVVLKKRSVADRLRDAGGVATEEQQRAWTASATNAQETMLARLASSGMPVNPEGVFVRTLNAFSASLDARALSVLESDPEVAGVYPVRAAYPTAASAGAGLEGAPGAQTALGAGGLDGAGVTVALLDTGVDITHPYIRGRLLPGLDVLDPYSGAIARPNPVLPGRPERHGTELAGLVVGARGPGGLHGVAPEASLLPIRVAGWQPDTSGGVAVYARTDQVLAGLELAVDPNGDGDSHDAARIALLGVSEPFAAFPDSPLARAAAGATALGTLLVTPAGNDGVGGPSYGTIGGPGGAEPPLTVGAMDTRPQSPSVHVFLRAGLAVLLSGEQPLAGTVVPGETVTMPVVALAPTRRVAVGGPAGFAQLFDKRGFSRVAGTAALLPNGTTSPEAVREAIAAGARVVLVDGSLPSGSLGTADPVDVAILGLRHETAVRTRAALARRIPVAVSVGAASFGANPSRSAIAPFSSAGLALDGATKPEVLAAGVGLATSEPGRNEDGAARYGTVSGSSAAAALTAGAAALVAQARPELSAAVLKGTLVASARPLTGGAGATSARSVDPVASMAVELVSQPVSLGLGAVAKPKQRVERTITLTNVSRRPLSVSVDPGPAGRGGAVLVAKPARGRIRPGRMLRVAVTATFPDIPRAPAALSGVLRVRVSAGTTLRVPWSVAVPTRGEPLVAIARLAPRRFVPSDLEPAVVTIRAGRVDGTPERPQLLPLERLEVQLLRGDRSLGTLISLRDVLPGRYRFGLTGRGTRGGRLGRGDYTLRVVGVPVGGGEADTASTRFTVE
jgi:minor extracellular serine protease Vpr